MQRAFVAVLIVLGEKALRRFVRKIAGGENMRQRGARQLAVIPKPWTANFHVGKLLPQPQRGGFIERQELRIVSGPHYRPVLRFIPDLPVTYAIVLPLGPAVVVMPHDAGTDLSPVHRILGRVDISFHRLMFDAFAQAIDDLRSSRADGCQIFVRRPEIIARPFGRHRTIGAVIEIASNMWVPGVTNRQNDHEESWFALGALDPAQQHRVEGVAEILRNSGRVEVTDDIRSAKWMKLVVNAAELIPSAIIDTALNDAARAPGMLDVMRAAGYEAMQAALADGATIMPIIGMPPVMSNHPERYVDQIFDEVLKTFSREDTLTTSLQDWRKGRRAEVQEVNGWVVDMLRQAAQ